MWAHHVFGLCKNVLEKRTGNNSERHFAIDAAEGQVIDFVSERRNIRSLGRIQVDHQHVLLIEIDMRSQIERESGISPLVFTESRSVDPDGRSRHGYFEVHEDMLAARLSRKPEAAAITRHELVAFLIEAVPRHLDVGVRNDHALITGIIKVARMGCLRDVSAVAPVAIDRDDDASRSSTGLGRVTPKSRLGKSGASDQRPGRLEKIATIHLRLGTIA